MKGKQKQIQDELDELDLILKRLDIVGRHEEFDILVPKIEDDDSHHISVHSDIHELLIWIKDLRNKVPRNMRTII